MTSYTLLLSHYEQKHLVQDFLVECSADPCDDIRSCNLRGRVVGKRLAEVILVRATKSGSGTCAPLRVAARTTTVPLS
jgi:hypothetical protein